MAVKIVDIPEKERDKTEEKNIKIESNPQLPGSESDNNCVFNCAFKHFKHPKHLSNKSAPGATTRTTSDTNSDESGNDNFDAQVPAFHKWASCYGLQMKSLIQTIKKKSARSLSVIPFMLSKPAKTDEEIDIDGTITRPEPSTKNFSYSELVDATDNFSPENLLGKGGSAEVFKGKLPDGRLVAVKKVTSSDDEDDDRSAYFLTELGIIAHINHPNATNLIGFSVDKGLHLVLQFSPYGSLKSMLFDSNECLDWKTRFKVAVGISEGLKYLHHDCHRRIIHRDITAANILLTQDYEAQISDFGLSRWLPKNWHQHVVHSIEGTAGYLAPEYFMHGIVDEKTDVFAFGVLLLEILTGRRAVDSSQQSLATWAEPFLESNKAMELVDPRLGDNYNPTEMQRAMLTASMCISHLATTRPTMTKVVRLLKNEDGPVDFHQISCGKKAVTVDDCDLKEYSYQAG